MSVDHASGVAAPKADPVFLHVRAGMTVIVDDGSDWRMANVIGIDGGAKNPKAPRCFRWQTWTPASSTGATLTL